MTWALLNECEVNTVLGPDPIWDSRANAAFTISPVYSYLH